MDKRLYALLLLLFLVPTGTLARTIRIPLEKPTINAGLEAADYGDTVLVSPGRYKENIALVYGVVLKGLDEKSIPKTIIDGMRRGPVVYAVTGGEISHFTITNGIEGILCENVNAKIHHNWIIDNHGSGIAAFITLPSIHNNVIYGNRWSGILAWGAKSLDTRIEHNVIIRNYYSGISLMGPSRVVVRDNILIENHEYALYVDPQSGQSQITYNNIFDNYDKFNRYAKINKTNMSKYPVFINRDWDAPNYYIATSSPLRKKGYGRTDMGLIEVTAVVVDEEDTDKDGILDKNDACPTIPEDMDNFQDSDGCPDYDNDKDGIPDQTDACPNSAEDFDGWQDEDGCPDPDNDKDGILDHNDRCPNDPETFNGYKDEDGCPDKIVEKIEKQFVLQGVNFHSGSAVLTEESLPILDQVVDLLDQHKQSRFEISGHTDASGSVKLNEKLSLDRANSVKKYLVDKGIDASRFVTKGYGPNRPIDSNDTPEGKAKNRRIEFYRLQ